jgi:futalosine hydrolase
LIWIVAAIESELNLLKKGLGVEFQGDLGGYAHYLGRVGNERVRLGVTGMGIASACLALGSFIGMEKPDMALMVGTAGAMPGSGLAIGDTIAARTEVLSEFGVAREIGIGDVKPLKFASLQQEIDLSESVTLGINDKASDKGPMSLGRILTVVGVSRQHLDAHKRAECFDVMAENMEGYGLALAGLCFGIKVAEIRGISNMAGDHDKSRWDFKGAREKTQTAVLEYLSKTF